MKKAIFSLTLIGGLLAGGLVHAAPLPAELIMGNGSSWQGELIRRDGNWLEFQRRTSTTPIRIGANTVKEIRFNVTLDEEKIAALIANREFERVINAIARSIEPFSEYTDIPSNLTKHNALLMELYHRTQQYDKSLEISSKIAMDSRNPKLQSKARTYQALSLIESGRADEAQSLLNTYGWTQGDEGGDASPEALYITAKLLVLNEKYSEAMELAARIVAFNSQDPDWMRPAEMLCAEIYTDLGMYDSADEVCRQIVILYRNTPEFDQAKKLKIKIEKLRAEKQVQENLTSEEA